MECRRNAARFARNAVHFATLMLMWFFAIVGALVAVAARAAEPATDVAAALHDATQYQYRFRAGDLDVVPEYVAVLESATRALPDNADLQYALGRAYLMQGARAMLPGGNPADAPKVVPLAIAALKRALQINPDHPLALAQLGAIQGLIAVQMNRPQLAAASVAQMNRAVELAPDSTMVRLVRGFLGVNLPDELRDHAAEIADLDFIIDAADFSRAGDYVRIMRGDLDLEQGRPEQARAHYQLVVDGGSRAAVDAKARLAALSKRVVPMEEIRTLRSQAGAQCTMCHGP